MTPEELVQSHWDRMVAFVRRYCRQHRLERLRDEMESLCAERLWRVAMRYDANHKDGSTFWSYAYYRMWGTCVEIVKKKYRHREMGSDPLIHSLTNIESTEHRLVEPSVMPPEIGQREECEQILTLLTARQSQVMRLVYLDGRSHAAAAQVLGLSVECIGSHVFNSLAKVRKELSPC